MRRIGLLVSGAAAAVASVFGAVFARRKRQQAREERRAARRAARAAGKGGRHGPGARAGAKAAPAPEAALAPEPGVAPEVGIGAEPGSASTTDATGTDDESLEGAEPRDESREAIEAGPSDELRAIKGVGTVTVERLRELGYTTLPQVAAWSDDDIERVAAHIHIGAERIRREDWVSQARDAVAGRESGESQGPEGG
jgi:predicted flap endonuclease-1-like 5' DNA nuclease